MDRSPRQELVDEILGAAIPHRTSGPGVIVGVVTADGLIASRATGSARLDAEEPLTERTAFYVASVSKQYTALCVLLASDDGRLSLDDPLHTFFPWLPSWASDVRVAHLMWHAAGLPDYGGLIEATGRSLDEPFTDEDIVDVLASSCGPEYRPGAAVVYSNTGFVILGMIVRIATDATLRAFAAERVFGPLGMADTFYRDDHTQPASRLADGHAERDAGVERVVSCFDRVGDGGVISTLSDWSLWESALLDRREPWLALSERIAAPFVLADGSVSSWRAGVVVQDVAGESATLAGGTALGYRAFSVRLEKAGFSVCCLANLETADVRGLSLAVVDALRSG